MKLVFVLFVVFITINSEKVDSEEEDFTDDEDKLSEEDDYDSDEDTNNESDKHADKDKHLQNYLGLDRGFVSNKITKNWCPEDCEKEGQMYENPNLSSYCICERNRTNNKLNTVQYYCAKHEIYNSTMHDCHKLKGNGYATCVIRNKTCPSNKTGVFKHPNKDLYKNYIVCLNDMVIVAQCNYMAYYNDTEKRCVRNSDKKTILAYSDCKEAPTIDCREPGVIPVEEYLWRNNNSAIIPENCKNCYYLCNDRDLYSYDLAIHCFPDTDTNQTVINMDTTIWDYTTRYINQTTTINYKYETSATAGIVAKPLVIEPTNAKPAGLSTTMKQTTTAIETDESKASPKSTKVFNISATETTTEMEVQSTEKEKSSITSILSTGKVKSEDLTTIIARTEDGQNTPHTESTMFDELSGVTYMTNPELISIATEPGGIEIIDTGRNENETSSGIPETLTKEVLKSTTEYSQSAGQSTTIGLSTKQTTTAAETDKSETSPQIVTDFEEISFATGLAIARTKLDSTQEEKSTTALILSQKPTKLARTTAIATINWERSNITTHKEQTVTKVLGGTATTRIRPSITETTKTKMEIQSTEEDKSSTTSILSTGQVISENATTIISSTKEGEIIPHSESNVNDELSRVTHTTNPELSSIATEPGGIEITDKGRIEGDTSSSIPETVTKEVLKSITDYPQSADQSTTIIFSTTQTTAAETDSPQIVTDYEETSFSTELTIANTEIGSTQEEKSTTALISSKKPTKLTRTPAISTRDWERTNITTHKEQTVTEKVLGGTATTRIRPSSTETTKTKIEVQSTEKEKSSTTSILSTGQVTSENATTIIDSTKDGEIIPHTESTVIDELSGVTHTTNPELSSTEPEGLEITDKGRNESDTSSDIPETLTKEVIKSTTEYPQSVGRSTTIILSTTQTTAAEVEETSFATEPEKAETDKVGSPQEEKSTTALMSSKKPTKLARIPATATRDWERTNITTHKEQTVTEVLGGGTTTTIRPSTTETTKTKMEIQSTEEEKSSTTSILTTEQVVLENATTIIASIKDGEIIQHTESTVIDELSGVTHTTNPELSSTATEPGAIETTDKGRNEKETSSGIPETLTKEVLKSTTEYPQSVGQSTTIILSTIQTTAAEEGETSFATEPAKAETDKVGSTQEEKSTTALTSSKKPTKLTRTPAISTRDRERTNITTHKEQTVTEKVLGGTATTRIRPSTNGTTKTKTEVQSTEKEKSSTTSILSTELVLENATTIIASIKDGEIIQHTESTVIDELSAVTHTTNPELSSTVTEPGGIKITDERSNENKISSSIPETLTKEVLISTTEYPQSVGQLTTIILSTTQTTAAEEGETSFATEPAKAETDKVGSTQEEKSTTALTSSKKPTKLTRTPAISTRDRERTNITTHKEQTVTEKVLGGTATTRIRPSTNGTTKTKIEVQSTEKEKSSTPSILSTGQVISENATTIIASIKDGEIIPHTEITVFDELSGVSHMTNPELSSTATEPGAIETTDKGRNEKETSSGIPERLTKEMLKSTTEYPQSVGQSTTIILSTTQTTAAEETSFATAPEKAETDKVGSPQEEKSTTALMSSKKPTKLTKTPAISTRDWERTNITTHKDQTVIEKVLDGTATTRIRPSSTETTKTKIEVQSTEKEKSSTTSILSTGQVISENATTITASIKDGEIIPHTESTVFDELSGVTHTTNPELSSTATEPEGLEITDKGRNESDTSSDIPETLTKEVLKSTTEYPQLVRQSTTIILSTTQTTAAEVEKTSFATAPEKAETDKVGSPQEEKSTTALMSSKKPTKLARIPATATRDWERTNITTHKEQTVTEVLGGRTTTTIRPSTTETTKTKMEIQSTEEEKSSTTSILTTEQVVLENATTIIASIKDGEIIQHTESTVIDELSGVTHTTNPELSSTATEPGAIETTDTGRNEKETSSGIPETLTKEVLKSTTEYPQSVGQSTTIILSTTQTTAAEEGETSFATEPAKAETDKVGTTQEEKLTTALTSSNKPTKLTRTPAISTRDRERTNITTHKEQTVTEKVLGGTATTRIRPSANGTTKTKTEVQSTEKEKSSTTSILSTGQVISENATTIIASIKYGEIIPHTEITVFDELSGVSHTTNPELSSTSTEPGAIETTDKGRNEKETSSGIPERLTKEMLKSTTEYPQSVGQSTTIILSTTQTTAAEVEETSFATEPEKAETDKVGSPQEEKSTTALMSSKKPTKLARIPATATRDWERTNITTHKEQTVTEVLGDRTTTTIRPSTTETTKTKMEIQTTEEEKSSTTSILTTEQVVLENATTIIASIKDGEIIQHTESTVIDELSGVTHTTNPELSSTATEPGAIETTDKGRNEKETSSGIPETLIKEVLISTREYPLSAGQSTTTILSTKQTAAKIDKSETSPQIATDFDETSFATGPAIVKNEVGSTEEEQSTTALISSQKPTKLARTTAIATRDWERTNITTHKEHTVTERVLGSTATIKIRPSETETTKTKIKVLSTEEEKSSTTSILSTGQVTSENATTIIDSTKDGVIIPHTESTVIDELSGVTHTTNPELSSIVTESGGIEITDKGRNESDTSSSIPEKLTTEVLKSTAEYPQTAGKSTTTVLSTKQTTAAEADKSETSSQIATDFEETSFSTELAIANTEVGSTQEEKLTTALISSKKPPKLTRTPAISTRDWKRTNITTHKEQKVTEVLGGITTNIIRSSTTEATKTQMEIQSTEEEKSSTTSILSTGRVISENATTIIASIKDGEIIPHTESTVFDELSGVTHTTNPELSSIATEPGGTEITDKGRNENKTSSGIPETLTKEVLKSTAGQSTTTILSTNQATTAAETDRLENSSQIVTDFDETSFATEPAITETDTVGSIQEEKSTVVSVSSQVPTKLTKIPVIITKNITTYMEQTATEEVSGDTATTRIRPSATKTTETKIEVPGTQLMTDIETNPLTTEPTITETDVYSTTEESDISEKLMCQQNNFQSQECNKEGFFRFNGSCTLHYECYYSRTCRKIIPSDIYECPYCLKFNAKDMKCDLPENVPECTYHKLTNTPHCSNRRHKRRRCTGPGKFAVPENNEKYYDCIDKHNNNEYHLSVKKCPKGHKFNDVTKECEKKKDCEKGFRCGRRQPSQLAGKCGKKHYAYDKYNCQKFYHCQHKKPKIPLCCPENYVFNVNYCQSQNTTLFCNWEELKKVLYKHNKHKNKG